MVQWSTWENAEGPEALYDEQAIFFDAVAHALADARPTAHRHAGVLAYRVPDRAH
jgi:hypothetical protein